MRTFVLDNLDGHAFTYTPARARAFAVVRANPGTIAQMARSGALVQVPAAAAVTVATMPNLPLVLYPGDRVTITDSEEFLDHLVATGQAHEVSE